MSIDLQSEICNRYFSIFNNTIKKYYIETEKYHVFFNAHSVFRVQKTYWKGIMSNSNFNEFDANFPKNDRFYDIIMKENLVEDTLLERSLLPLNTIKLPKKEEEKKFACSFCNEHQDRLSIKGEDRKFSNMQNNKKACETCSPKKEDFEFISVEYGEIKKKYNLKDLVQIINLKGSYCIVPNHILCKDILFFKFAYGDGLLTAVSNEED